MPDRIVLISSLILISVLIITWFVRPRFSSEKLVKLVTFTSGLVVFGLLIGYSVTQYKIWSEDELTKFFLPPHRNTNYFLGYVLARFFAQYLISGIIAAVFFIAAKRHNTKHQDQFFYPEEPFYIALGIFLTGHPLWIVYLLAVTIGYIIFSLFYRIRWQKTKGGEEPRISFYYGWLITALFVIIFRSTIMHWPIINLLIFSKDTLLL